ncbi:MAG: BMP family ABC transporter substrate-binding protein [Actinomycetota bacterium]
MRKSKQFAAVAFVATFGLVAVACGDDKKASTATTTTVPCVAKGATKVGLAFDTGGRGDGTFNDSAARGADQATCQLGATVTELEATNAEDRQPNLENLTKAGNGLVVSVGFAFGDGLAVVAKANPKTLYANIDGYYDKATDNVTFLSFAAEQGSYLVGAAAALKSKTHHIGFIGGQEIDLIKAFEAGYTAGAKYIDPTIKVDVKYLGAAGDNAAWGSPDKAKEIALAWYAAGADVIYTAAGGSGAGTIDAAVQANKWAIGVDSDQYLLSTPAQQKHILTSMLKRVDNAVFLTVKSFQAGTLKGGVQVFDLSTNGVGYSTSGGYLDDVVGKLDAIKADIVAKKIIVPTKP